MSTTKNSYSLVFLAYCLGEKKDIPEICYGIDWNKMLVWAEQQAIVGVMYGGILGAGKALNIPFNALMEWIGYANQIENRNKSLNRICVKVVDELRDAGFQCIILKGQGNTIMYPNPQLRTPGDIDVWIYGHTDSAGYTSTLGDGNLRKEIVDFARKKDKDSEIRFYHVEFMDGDVAIEAHFMPGIMNNPVYNRRLQRWYNKLADGKCLITEVDLPDGVGRIPVPSREFNIIYQLAHMMHHFFDEGIGLRQMIDYYYLLRKAKGDVRCQMDDVRKTLKYLNLYNFAGAVMYIMKEVLGLDDEYLIVPVDERRGQTLLKEILKGGNFGHYSELDQNNAAKKYFQKTWRNMQLVKEYPAEALCEPIFRTWHFFWRMMR